MATGLVAWGRFFAYGSDGKIITNPDGSPQRITVPAPPDGTGKPWLWDFLRSQAKDISAHFDVVLLPPCSLTQSGSHATGDGYGVLEYRNLDGTRYGSLEALGAAIAALRSCGTGTWLDLVMHQMASLSKRYPNNRRGAQVEGWFRGHTSWNAATGTWNDPIPPYSQRDQVPDPANDFAFGKELCYQNCNPPGASLANAIDYVRWVAARTGALGFRFDDTKGTHAASVKQIMDAVAYPFVSEYFEGNPGLALGWAENAPLDGRSAIYDFTAHWRMQAACNGYDATLFDQGGSGCFAINPGLSVLFVDNPDTDTSDGQQVKFNKALAYAYMLNLPCRMALVYGKDYYPDAVWPGAYGLKKQIDNLCWISRMFAFGAFERRWVDRDVYAYTRDGNGGIYGWSGGLLVALNFNTGSSRTVTLQTTFGPNRWLHDYTGHAPDVHTDGSGSVTITIPANTNSSGQSYVCYAPGGVDQPVTTHGHPVIQTIEGAPDLLQPSASNTSVTLHERIYVARNSKIQLELSAQLPVSNATLVATVVAQDTQTSVSWQRIGAAAPGQYFGKAPAEGWYEIWIEGFALPLEGVPYKLKLTYTGA